MDRNNVGSSAMGTCCILKKQNKTNGESFVFQWTPEIPGNLVTGGFRTLKEFTKVHKDRQMFPQNKKNQQVSRKSLHEFIGVYRSLQEFPGSSRSLYFTDVYMNIQERATNCMRLQ